MPRHKPIHKRLKPLPADFNRQEQPGSFEHALGYLVDHALDPTPFHACSQIGAKKTSIELFWHELMKGESTLPLLSRNGFTLSALGSIEPPVCSSRSRRW
jgi:hypothetical protein